MKSTLNALAVAVCCLATVTGAKGSSTQFDYLAPGYTQQIYSGIALSPSLGSFGVDNAGMVWTSSGTLITRSGNQLTEYALTASAVHQGTNVHPVLNTYTVAGLSADNTSLGITSTANGDIYANTPLGLQRISPGYASATTVAVISGPNPGGRYGITTLPDGRIAYAASSVPGVGNQIYIYNPADNSNTLIFTSSANVVFDDIEANANGQIALAGLLEKQLLIIDISGNLINTVSTGNHSPDGLAFVAGYGQQGIMVNNNDGSITRYDFNAGYGALSSAIDIATTNAGRRAYGDLAACGPDGAFYVTQYNFGTRGSNFGFGTRWDNGAQTGEASIVRISSSTPGESLCASATVPEPGAAYLSVLALGLALMFSRARVSCGAA